MPANTQLNEVGPPDIETASDAYARRFNGGIGEFLLDVQRQAVLSLLGTGTNHRILEVGGGHAQLTGALLAAGHEVWVQGSSAEALARVSLLAAQYPGRLHCIVSPLEKLPGADRFFDAVIAIRLLAHLAQWQEILREMARVCDKHLIFDFAPSESFNVFYPLLFRLKQKVERNTRTFLRFSAAEVADALRSCGWKLTAAERQFFLPMVFHRCTKFPALSRKLELLCRLIGLTRLLGSPAIVRAERI